MNKKTIILALVSFTAGAILMHLAIFGHAIGQGEDNIGILFALPKVIFSSGIAHIGDETYLVKDSNLFIRTMENQGFVYVEQLGAGYVFEKNGEKYLSTGRMYSSYYMIFTVPVKINL
jgi:hypothetical protein